MGLNLGYLKVKKGGFRLMNLLLVVVVVWLFLLLLEESWGYL